MVVPFFCWWSMVIWVSLVPLSLSWNWPNSMFVLGDHIFWFYVSSLRHQPSLSEVSWCLVNRVQHCLVWFWFSSRTTMFYCLTCYWTIYVLLEVSWIAGILTSSKCVYIISCKVSLIPTPTSVRNDSNIPLVAWVLNLVYII